MLVNLSCLTIYSAIAKIPSLGFSAITDYLTKLLSGKIAWYMPCCIIAEILFFFLIKNTKKLSAVIVGVLVLFGLGSLFAHLDILNYLKFNRAMIVQVFLLAGYLYRHYEGILLEKITRVHIVVLSGAYIAAAIVSLVIWPGKAIDVHQNYYYNYPFCFAMIFLGCFVAFISAEKINKVPAVLRFIGQNTLVYYLLHSVNISFFQKGLDILNINLPQFFTDSFVYSILTTLVACVMCGLEAVVINKFIPEIAKKNATPVPKHRYAPDPSTICDLLGVEYFKNRQ